MPDAQTLNAVASTYGLSNLITAGGGINWWNIIGGTVFSIIGWFAFLHGKKEKTWRPMVLGILLMVYPYFVSNTLLAFAIGIGLTAALYYWRE
jgi:hypothetical protein